MSRSGGSSMIGPGAAGGGSGATGGGGGGGFEAGGGGGGTGGTGCAGGDDGAGATTPGGTGIWAAAGPDASAAARVTRAGAATLLNPILNSILNFITDPLPKRPPSGQPGFVREKTGGAAVGARPSLDRAEPAEPATEGQG